MVYGLKRPGLGSGSPSGRGSGRSFCGVAEEGSGAAGLWSVEGAVIRASALSVPEEVTDAYFSRRARSSAAVVFSLTSPFVWPRSVTTRRRERERDWASRPGRDCGVEPRGAEELCARVVLEAEALRALVPEVVGSAVEVSGVWESFSSREIYRFRSRLVVNELRSVVEERCKTRVREQG